MAVSVNKNYGCINEIECYLLRNLMVTERFDIICHALSWNEVKAR